MEIKQADRQPRPVVAFDFDGTLTIRDSYTEFLRWHAGSGAYLVGLVRLVPELMAYPVRRDRGHLKAAATRLFLAETPVEALEAAAAQFCDRVWDEFMRPDALDCWHAWGNKGVQRVIVTASPRLTVQPFARRLGADGLIGTELEVRQGVLTGDFASPNCRGAEKVRRLQTVFGPELKLVAAYGDTSGDTEMLAMAEHSGWREFVKKP